VLLNQPGHVTVENSQRLGQHLDHGDATTPMNQRLGDLHADKPPADNDNVPGPALAEGRTDTFGVAHAMKRKNVGQIPTRYRRNDRRSPRRQNQLVVLYPRIGFAGQVPHTDSLGPPIDFDHLSLVQHADVLDLLKEHGIAHNPYGSAHELLLLPDGPGNIVWQAATGVRQQFTFFDNGYLRIRAHTDDFGGDLGTGGHAANDHDTQVRFHRIQPFPLQKLFSVNYRKLYNDFSSAQIRRPTEGPPAERIREGPH